MIARLRRHKDRDLVAALAGVEEGLLSDYIRAGLRLVLQGGAARPTTPAVPSPSVSLVTRECETAAGQLSGHELEDGLDDLLAGFGVTMGRHN